MSSSERSASGSTSCVSWGHTDVGEPARAANVAVLPSKPLAAALEVLREARAGLTRASENSSDRKPDCQSGGSDTRPRDRSCARRFTGSLRVA